MIPQDVAATKSVFSICRAFSAARLPPVNLTARPLKTAKSGTRKLFQASHCPAVFLADSANMRHILILQCRIPAGRIVIAFVQTQMLRQIFCYLRTLNYNCLNRCFEQFCIMHVRCCHNCCKRAAVSFNEDTAFYAVFCPVRGVWPDTVPPKRALLIAVSADCHLKSIPPSSVQSAMRATQILSSRPHCVHR